MDFDDTPIYEVMFAEELKLSLPPVKLEYPGQISQECDLTCGDFAVSLYEGSAGTSSSFALAW